MLVLMLRYPFASLVHRRYCEDVLVVTANAEVWVEWVAEIEISTSCAMQGNLQVLQDRTPHRRDCSFDAETSQLIL